MVNPRGRRPATLSGTIPPIRSNAALALLSPFLTTSRAFFRESSLYFLTTFPGAFPSGSARSSEIGNARVRKMRERDQLLASLQRDAIVRISGIADSPQYPQIMTKLITQVGIPRS
jgi:hypothetical protein